MKTPFAAFTGVALWSVVACAGTAGLVAHYTFEEGGGRVLRDHSGNGNHGKILGGAKWVKGAWGTALEFDGRDDYVQCGTAERNSIRSLKMQ